MFIYRWFKQISHFKKIGLISIILLIILCVYSDVYHVITLTWIRAHQSQILHWTTTHYYLSVLTYLFLFAFCLASTLPCATVFTLLGGYLFGVIGILYALTGTLLGAVMLYYISSYALGQFLIERSSAWMKRIESGFQQGAFYYIISLRLIPVLPCWVTNVISGALNIPIKVFLPATILGLLPSTIIYVFVGKGLGRFMQSDTMSITDITFSPMVFFPLMTLALLSLFPIVYRLLKK